MDFFESQDRARRRSGRLVFLYGLAVLLIVVSIYFVVLFAGNFAGWKRDRSHPAWDPELLLGVSAATIGIIALGSFYRIIQLRAGGSRVAEMMGGRRVNLATSDPDERRLVNVVEEMAIASGVPVPEIFVMDTEEGINAFAAGYTPSDAAVAVTKGTLQTLSRDELQGVIAHEFSHILNGDMRLNIRLIGLLNGILLLHLIGFTVVRSLRFTRVRSSRSGKGGGGGAIVVIIIVGVALMVIGYIGVLCSRIIQAAVSRQREYLADAAAVQFTRNPDGIAGALKKIGGASLGSRISATHAMEASHMFFANGITSSLANMFATHPPLTQRIQAIDPSFDGKSWITPSRPKSRKSKQPPPIPPTSRSPFDPITKSFPMTPEVLLATIGALGSDQIARASQILELLPNEVTKAVRESAGAEAAIYALLLSDEPALQDKQMALVRSHSPQGVAREVSHLRSSMSTLPPEARLPLVDLALPALKQLSPQQFDGFRRTVREISASDDQLSLFEFALEKVLLLHLDRHFHQGTRPTTQYYSAAGLTPEFSVLLSALAHAGGSETKSAFAAGQSRLPELALQLETRESCTLDRVDAALNKSQLAAFPVKKQLLEAAIAVSVSDGKIAPEEAELLRAIADSLDCPMPPIG